MSNIKCPSCGSSAILSKAPEDLNLKDVKEKGYVFFCINESCKGVMQFRIMTTREKVDKMLSLHKRMKEAKAND